MNDKLKRVVAIIALVLVVIFSISFIVYLFDDSLLNGAIGDIAIWSGCFGLLLFAVLWISHSFPSQQVKDEERNRLYEEAEKKSEEEADEIKESDKESDKPDEAERGKDK